MRAILTTGLAVAIALGTAHADGEIEERFVRYYLPWGTENPRGEWQPESSMPRDPQDASKMVIWEVTRYRNATAPTPEQQKAMDDLVEASFKAAETNEWYRFDKGYESGYRRMFQDDSHYANLDYVRDDALLDPERPEFLMYYDTPMGKQLVGFMFLMNHPTESGPQIGGPETLWHFHIWPEPFCLADSLLIVGRPNREGVCERGFARHRSPEMIHVWLIDHPDGTFATRMEIDPVLLPGLLEKRRAERGY